MKKLLSMLVMASMMVLHWELWALLPLLKHRKTTRLS